MVQLVSPTEPGTGTLPKTALVRKTDAGFLFCLQCCVLIVAVTDYGVHLPSKKVTDSAIGNGAHGFTGNLTCDNYNCKTYQQQRSASLIRG
jgi:hypothetical protein